MKKKMKVILVLIGIIVLSTLTGCGEKKQENDEGMEKLDKSEQLATKEYLMEYYGLTEEDLEGLDIEKQIEYYGMSNAVITESTRDDILGYLMDGKIRMETEIEDTKYNLSYLVEAPEFDGEYPSFDDIKYLAYFKHEAEAGYSYFFDFDKNKIYYLYGGVGVYEDYRRANETYELTDEIKKTVIQTLKDAEVNKWEYYYESGEYREPIHWYFGMEFEDGSVVSNTGITQVPDGMETVVNMMKTVAPMPNF